MAEIRIYAKPLKTENGVEILGSTGVALAAKTTIDPSRITVRINGDNGSEQHMKLAELLGQNVVIEIRWGEHLAPIAAEETNYH